MGIYVGDAKRAPFKEVISMWLAYNLYQGENRPKEDRIRQKNTEG
jgi:hypothetical protein